MPQAQLHLYGKLSPPHNAIYAWCKFSLHWNPKPPLPHKSEVHLTNNTSKSSVLIFKRVFTQMCKPISSPCCKQVDNALPRVKCEAWFQGE